ncbi:tetraacyldisaccharide 4'-kinase [Opitutia bacterium ISCC 51]|nr:tetraacyldisaccharide 4'-kinase [Opitutae bacterium ISCC 51]QXD26448.1 tetraacyldisaccharide 4'-kinase [Opitutae bacterium ISCC 52]
MLKRLTTRVNQSLERFALFAEDVIMDRRTGRDVALFAAFLRAWSYIFSGAVQLRLWLYEKRIFRTRHLGCLVVVVGNLTVGGTGKTPVVEKFARSLAAKGRKVAILSRGYKSKKVPLYKRLFRQLTHKGDPPPKVVSDGERVLLDSEEAGDEPFMLASNLPGVMVFVDKNRVNAGSYAIRKYGVDTLILDDGFQYLPLKGRLNLLLVDKTNPFGNRRMLPRGILREPVKHLKRASYVFITKSDGISDPVLEDTIRQHNPEADIIECAHRPQYLQHLDTGEKRPLSDLEGKRIGAFSAIADHFSFERFLREFGANVLYSRRFLDHHRFTDSELKHLFDQAGKEKLDFMVTTEKDAVRISKDFPKTIPLYYLRLEIDILSGDKDFEKAVDRICFPENKTELPFQANGDGNA